MTVSNDIDPRDRLVNKFEAASYLRLSHRTLDDWRHRPPSDFHLPFVRVGGCIRYRLGDLQDFVAAHTVGAAASVTAAAAVTADTPELAPA